MRFQIRAALLLALATTTVQAAWWDNRYAVLKAEGLATGYLQGQSRIESDGLRATLGSNNRIGYRDAQGQWAISPQFTRAQDFHEGKAVVWSDPAQPPFMIDRSGARVGDAPELARGLFKLDEPLDPSLRLYTVDRQGVRYSGVMTRDWRSLAEAQGENRYVVRDGQIVQVKDRYTVEKVLDLQGRVLLDKPMPWSQRPATDAIFARGLALRYDPASARYGYIDTAGSWVIPAQYSLASVFGDDGALVAGPRNSDGLYAGRLIDTQGKTLQRLPEARCYSEPSRGFLLARLPDNGKGQSEMGLMTTQGQVVARLTVAASDELCPEHIQWMDEQTLVAGRYWLRKDGSVVHDGLGDVRYDEILAIQPELGTAFVRYENAKAPATLEEARSQLLARKNSEDGFYDSVLLRPLRFARWDDLQEPEFHTYKAVRLYVDEGWRSGSSVDHHLHGVMVEVKVRDGRPAHDNIRVLAEAGCRIPPGWKLVKSGILVVPRSRWFGNEQKDWTDWVAEALGTDRYLWASTSPRVCEAERMVDGKVERQVKR